MMSNIKLLCTLFTSLALCERLGAGVMGWLGQGVDGECVHSSSVLMIQETVVKGAADTHINRSPRCRVWGDQICLEPEDLPLFHDKPPASACRQVSKGTSLNSKAAAPSQDTDVLQVSHHLPSSPVGQVFTCRVGNDRLGGMGAT